MSPGDPNAPEDTLALADDYQQKIFDISDSQKALAYAVEGWVIHPDGYDLVAIIQSQVKRIRHRRLSDCRQYLAVLADKVNTEINNAKEDGRLDMFPQAARLEQTTAWKFAKMLIAGYFDGMPILYRIEFVHYSGEHTEAMVIPYPNPQQCIFAGSRAVTREMYQANGLPVAGSRFSEYVKELGLDPSLDDAEEYAVGYVKACCSPLAIQIDAKCKAMGGHIHVAEITPAGLKWRIPPATHN